MDDVTYRGLVRTKETGGRRSRTLRLDDESLQVQAKEASITTSAGVRYLLLRYWTEEMGGWTHQVIDPKRPGLAGIIAVGYAHSEGDSWDMARQAAYDALGVEL